MNPHRLAWGPAHNFPFAQVIGLVTLVGLLFSREKKTIPINAITIVWIALIVWMNVSTMFALVPDLAAKEWDRVMKIQLFSFVSLMLIYGKQRIDALLAVITASIGFYAVKGGIFAVLTGGSSRVYGPPGGFIEDNNSLGLAIVMIVPLMLYLLSQIKQRNWRIAMIGAVGLSMLAILSTQSRGAFLAVSAMVMWVWLKSSRKFAIGAVIALMVPVFWFAMPDKWHERMATITEYEQDGSAMGRINAWGFAYNVAQDRPMVGGGFRVFVPELFHEYAPVPEDFHDAHSIYFEVLGELGFVGLALFLLLGALSLRGAGDVERLTRNRDDLAWANFLARMLQASLVGYATGGMFLGLAYWDLYYHLVVLIVVLREHVTKVLQTDMSGQQTPDPVASETEQRTNAMAGVRGAAT
jgi:probable O-glycosylation ligase (exosortase A-associated)